MKRLINSCFGLGRLPVAPGTWGSLPAVAVFIVMRSAAVPAVAVPVVMIILALSASVLCVKFAPASIQATSKTDPREVVLDEIAGQAVTFIGAFGMMAGSMWKVAAAGFFLFRLFDILKPYPSRRLEKLPAGWGVLADDLMAGIYAAVALQACICLGIV